MLVAPGVRKLLAPNPSPMTGPGTNTYLVGHGEVVVVDPGPDLPEHLAAIGAATVGERIAASLVTHGHPDHAPAAFRLREQAGTLVWGHPSLVGVDRPLADGEVVTLGRTRLVVYHTPGHSADHLSFWCPAERLLFAGDLVAGAGTVVLSEEPGALVRYLASLERVLALGPATLLPGHGPVVAAGVEKIREYLAHRAMRDEQILAVLRAGPASVESLVGRLYPDTPAALLPMAARNVRAHLERLETEGKARKVGEGWEISS